MDMMQWDMSRSLTSIAFSNKKDQMKILSIQGGLPGTETYSSGGVQSGERW